MKAFILLLTIMAIFFACKKETIDPARPIIIDPADTVTVGSAVFYLVHHNGNFPAEYNGDVDVQVNGRWIGKIPYGSLMYYSPPGCYANSNTVLYSDTPGTYIYFCNQQAWQWTGTFQIIKGDCAKVPLDTL